MIQHPWKIGTIVGIFSGLIVEAAVMYVSWQHNPQGVIHNELGVDWGYWFLLGFSWFVPTALMVSLICGGILAVAVYLRRTNAA